ncbi:hypothetical protein [Nocardioides sp. AE5]|uniref:type II secretion system F family protein n=1 Tax=Nocardioides sp. AE5 TaxID=2962573 RepID=UPI00288103C5|nr:hypothetical protein [Nocardioides sp. AE5]MDT0200554.1 hypothetical protein [Nocardioides sp. AE5]
MSAAVVAAASAAGAVLLLGPVPRGGRRAGLVLLAGAGAVGAVALGDVLAVEHLAPLCLGLVAVGGGWLLRRRLQAQARAEATAASVQDACEALATELATGRPVEACLADAVEVWAPMASIATAQHLGGSIPDALRSLAAVPGAGDLRLVAAAWQVSQRTGAGLSGALAEVVEALRAQRSTRRVVRSELSSARSTARLVAALPVLTLLLGSGTGGDPVGLLLTTPLGLACLAGGLGLMLAGLWWIESIAGSVEAAS